LQRKELTGKLSRASAIYINEISLTKTKNKVKIQKMLFLEYSNTTSGFPSAKFVGVYGNKTENYLSGRKLF